MNWLRALKKLLGRFWADIFKDSDFILGVEYLMSFYSKLTENQYLNWRNGMIAANLDVAQSGLPYTILIDTDSVVTEWYPWQELWEEGTASLFWNHLYESTADEEKMGWLAKSSTNIEVPDYMTDHVYGYSVILIKGLDYDFEDGRFLFYCNPAELELPTVKITDSEGNLHVYYRLFGVSMQTTKVCDPVTGFESQWLNGCSDIAWDIHTNGATYYNTKQLLGKATDSVVCEDDGYIETIWTEEGWNCCAVAGKPYCSSYSCNYAVGADVDAGSVLFGSLAMYKGTDTVTAAQVPGIKLTTDAGTLTALNSTLATYMSPGNDHTIILPLTGDNFTVNAYRAKCIELYQDDKVPFIQVPYPSVNPYEFVVKTLRRGRAVTVRLVADNLDYLAAAINCIRKSSCASGMLNVYVATTTEPPKTVDIISMVATAPTPSAKYQRYFNTTTHLIYTAVYNDSNNLVWSSGSNPDSNVIYKNAADSKKYRWVYGVMTDVTSETADTEATLNLSVFSADAGMAAVAVAETLTIKQECAEARVIL